MKKYRNIDFGSINSEMKDEPIYKRGSRTQSFFTGWRLVLAILVPSYLIFLICKFSFSSTPTRGFYPGSNNGYQILSSELSEQLERFLSSQSTQSTQNLQSSEILTPSRPKTYQYTKFKDGPCCMDITASNINSVI